MDFLESNFKKIIHIAKIQSGRPRSHFLFLHNNDNELRWYQEDRTATSVASQTIEEAIRLANKKWEQKNFTLLNCGFRYTGPERDEHGTNAYFYEMGLSQTSPGGIYLVNGVPNYVQGASQEALEIWKELNL